MDGKKIFCGTSCNLQRGSKWDVPQILSSHYNIRRPHAIIILDRPITQSHHFVSNMWNSAQVRICVDGGATRWDNYISGMPEQMRKSLKLPDLITGDFDSIKKDTMEKYKQRGCKVVHTPDQDYTDFTKSIMELYRHCIERAIEITDAFAFGQHSDRIDHCFGNIQTLFLLKEKNLFPRLQLFYISDDSLTWLLEPHCHHIINIPVETLQHKNAWCSLIPIGEPCLSVTTSGLKWNLENRALKFGDVVSTSNTFNGSPTVSVDCSHTLLWSLRIPSVMGKDDKFTSDN